jgi:gamma-tubulin complex component 5
VGQEHEIRAQTKGESYTLVLLFNKFAAHFEVLKHLWDIHTHSVLDWNKFPAHVCAAHLLAGIFSRIRNSANAMRANMALSIYLNTIRVYLMIVDVWWTEGRLDDWRGEFLVER